MADPAAPTNEEDSHIDEQGTSASEDSISTGKLVDTRKPGPWNGTAGPGRPKGLKNKATLQQREVAEMVLGKRDSPEFQQFIASQRTQLLAGILPPAILQLWLYYLLGKPKETVDVQGTISVEKVVREIVRVPNEIEEHVDAIH